MTDAEITALRKIATELKTWDYPTPVKSPNDLLRPWSMTCFERDTVIKAIATLVDGRDEARVENVTDYIKAINTPQTMAQAYLRAARAGEKMTS